MKATSLKIVFSTFVLGSIFLVGISQANDLSDKHQPALSFQKKGLFDKVKVMSNHHDVSQGKVYIRSLDMTETEIDKPRNSGNRAFRTWELTAEDKEGLSQLYQNAMRKQFEEAGYQLVNIAAPGTIVVAAGLLKLHPNAPKDDIKSRRLGEKYITEGAGSMTIAFDISVNGETILKIEDKARAGNFWGKNDRFNNKHDVKRLINKWTRNLLLQLGN